MEKSSNVTVYLELYNATVQYSVILQYNIIFDREYDCNKAGKKEIIPIILCKRNSLLQNAHEKDHICYCTTTLDKRFHGCYNACIQGRSDISSYPRSRVSRQMVLNTCKICKEISTTKPLQNKQCQYYLICQTNGSMRCPYFPYLPQANILQGCIRNAVCLFRLLSGTAGRYRFPPNKSGAVQRICSQRSINGCNDSNY